MEDHSRRRRQWQVHERRAAVRKQSAAQPAPQAGAGSTSSLEQNAGQSAPPAGNMFQKPAQQIVKVVCASCQLSFRELMREVSTHTAISVVCSLARTTTRSRSVQPVLQSLSSTSRQHAHVGCSRRSRMRLENRMQLIFNGPAQLLWSLVQTPLECHAIFCNSACSHGGLKRDACHCMAHKEGCRLDSP